MYLSINCSKCKPLKPLVCFPSARVFLVTRACLPVAMEPGGLLEDSAAVFVCVFVLFVEGEGGDVQESSAEFTTSLALIGTSEPPPNYIDYFVLHISSFL